MKKLICALVVLVAALPAGASVDISACVVEGPCADDEVVIRVVYDATSEANSVRAFALDITIEGDANIVDVNCLNGDYNIYPGTIQVDSRGNVTDRGSCLCSGVLPETQPGLGSKGVTIEMGSAYEPGVDSPPADSNTLVEFTMQCSTLDRVNVVLAQNTIRGGVVMENPHQAVTVNLSGLSFDFMGPCSLCYWPCWDYSSQCHGDSDGDGDVDTADWPAFRDSFAKSYPDHYYEPCADYDRDGDVDTADWPEFRDNFAKVPPNDCSPGDLNEVLAPPWPWPICKP